MDELLKQAAQALGIPEAMALRSAQARAKAEGVSPEDVLAAWAGGGPIEAGTAPESAPVAAPPPAEPQPAEPQQVAAAVAEPEEAEVEVLAAVTPMPAESPPSEEAPRERLRIPGGVPRWLVGLFIVIPAVAFFYAVFLPSGPGCGDGAQLAVDPVSGNAVNCDLSAYGVSEVNYFAMGEEVYIQCAACHGSVGQGGGNFPVLAGGAVLQTFPTCSDHVAWVQLGTLGWPDSTYGATAKPVGGSGAQMPSFGTSLSDEQLRSVVLFERVEFGGEELSSALTDCGLDEVTGAS